MKHRLCIFFSAVLLILAVLAVCPGASAEPVRKEYTIMFYICGADLERDNGQETAGMSEILASRYNTEQVNVIGLLGGTPRWAGNRYNPDVLSVVDISGRRPTTLEELPLSPMSDPETLTSFLAYCKERFPAQHYILVISDHGGGPLGGCCVDYLFNRTTLGVSAMGQAMAGSAFADRGLDIIAFNCCLMGSAEIGNVLSPYAQYMVATEDSMFGMQYDWIAGIENDESVLSTAGRIAQSTYLRNKEAIERQKSCQLNSVAVVDLQKMPGVVAALDAFMSAQKVPDPDTFTAFSQHRRDSVAFGITESGGNSQFDLVDIGSLVHEMEGDPSPEGQALVEAIRDAVPVHYSDVEGCMGLTVYHPYSNKIAAENGMETYAGLGFSPAYVDYVINYTSVMTGKPLANWAGLLTNKTSEKDLRTIFILSLTEEQDAHYADSTMKVLYREEKDGAYRFVHFTDNVYYEKGVLRSEFVDNALYAVDGDGRALTPSLPYTLSGENTLLVPAVLSRSGEDRQDPVEQKVLIYCSLDPVSKQLTPGGIAVWDEAMNVWTNSFSVLFTDYQQISIPLQARKETRNAEDILLPFDEWELVSEEAWTAPIDGSWSFCLLPETLDRTRLFATFEVRDSQSNRYSSELYQVDPTHFPPRPVIQVTYDDAGLALIDNLTVTQSQDCLILSAGLTNITEKEAILTVSNLSVNGIETGLTSDTFGTGANWGVLKGEQQLLTLPIPESVYAGQDAVTSILFTLILKDAETGEFLGEIPVEVTLFLSLQS